MRHLHVAGLVGALAAMTFVQPAFADGPVGIVAGGAFPQSSPYVNTATTQFNVNASYDVAKFGPLPLRASVVGDYAGGTNLSDYGVGVGLRLTTPIYAGLTLGVYNTSTNGFCAYPGAQGGAACGTLNSTNFGSTYFVGVRLFSVPGASLSVQGGYRQIPSVNGVDPSGPAVGLRLQI